MIITIKIIFLKMNVKHSIVYWNWYTVWVISLSQYSMALYLLNPLLDIINNDMYTWASFFWFTKKNETDDGLLKYLSISCQGLPTLVCITHTHSYLECYCGYQQSHEEHFYVDYTCGKHNLLFILIVVKKKKEFQQHCRKERGVLN